MKDKKDLPEIDQDKLMSTEEIADVLGVTARTVQMWAKSNEFPRCQRLGRGVKAPYIIPWGDVLNYLNRK